MHLYHCGNADPKVAHGRWLLVAYSYVPHYENVLLPTYRGHPVGNPGVGHATAFTISRVLSTALAKPWADIVPGAPRDGTVLMKQRMCDTRTMEQLGLVNVWNERNANKVGGWVYCCFTESAYSQPTPLP